MERSISTYLANVKHVVETIFKGHDGSIMKSAWRPGEADRYGVPIGGPDSPVAGNLVGERASDTFILAVAQHPSNPFNLENNGGYDLKEFDHDDLVYCAIDGRPAYDVLVFDRLAELGISADPHGTVPPTPGRPDGGTVQGGPVITGGVSGDGFIDPIPGGVNQPPASLASSTQNLQMITIDGVLYRMTLEKM